MGYGYGYGYPAPQVYGGGGGNGVLSLLFWGFAAYVAVQVVQSFLNRGEDEETIGGMYVQSTADVCRALPSRGFSIEEHGDFRFVRGTQLLCVFGPFWSSILWSSHLLSSCHGAKCVLYSCIRQRCYAVLNTATTLLAGTKCTLCALQVLRPSAWPSCKWACWALPGS